MFLKHSRWTGLIVPQQADFSYFGTVYHCSLAQRNLSIFWVDAPLYSPRALSPILSRCNNHSFHNHSLEIKEPQDSSSFRRSCIIVLASNSIVGAFYNLIFKNIGLHLSWHPRPVNEDASMLLSSKTQIISYHICLFTQIIEGFWTWTNFLRRLP